MQSDRNYVLFFDVYQTLLEVKVPLERSDFATGWEAFVSELQKHGVTVSADDFSRRQQERHDVFYSLHDRRRVHYNQLALVTEILKDDFGCPLSSEEVSRLLYAYRKASRGRLGLYPHVFETLTSLSREYTLAVASYTQGCYTHGELRETGIEQFFSYFIYSSDIGLRKELPAFYEHALRTADREPDECMMIGDNYTADVSVPESVGMHSIWVKNPITMHNGPAEDDSIDALAIEDFDRLPAMVASSFAR